MFTVIFLHSVYHLTFRSDRYCTVFLLMNINLPTGFLSTLTSELIRLPAVSPPSKASVSADHPCVPRCSFSLSSWENLSLHGGQVRGLSLVWIKRCLLSLFSKLNPFPHWEHLWRLVPACNLWCRCRAPLFENFFPHTRQQDRSMHLSSCWSWMSPTQRDRDSLVLDWNTARKTSPLII